MQWKIRGALSLDLRECPTSLVDDRARHWLRLYTHYQHGHLYRAGGIADQPAIYLQAMALITSHLAHPGGA